MSRKPETRPRSPRSDAAVNRERVLDAATIAVHQQGERVPIAVIAADAGVGVGTVYRHFPTRQDLLAALSHRSFRLVLENARSAAACDGSALEGLQHFLERALACRDELILPLHGGPVDLDQQALELRIEIRRYIQTILDRGRHEGTIHAGITPVDVIMMGALLASPLPTVEDWDTVARRQMQIYLAGLAAVEPSRLRQTGPASTHLAGASAPATDRQP